MLLLHNIILCYSILDQLHCASYTSYMIHIILHVTPCELHMLKHNPYLHHSAPGYTMIHHAPCCSMLHRLWHAGAPCYTMIHQLWHAGAACYTMIHQLQDATPTAPAAVHHATTCYISCYTSYSMLYIARFTTLRHATQLYSISRLTAPFFS